jgi:hypothetical protein
MFRCRVSNAYGSTTSTAARLTVSNNQAPVATINAPAWADYSTTPATSSFSGSGNDPEEGVLSSAAFSWTMAFHHDTHTHPFLGPIVNTTGGISRFRLQAKRRPTFYRIHLTVTDSNGAQGNTFVDIVPNVVTLTLLTEPSDLELTLDGQPIGTPSAVDSVVGMTRTLGAPTSQRVNKANYTFDGWSDGGAQIHDVSTPATDTTYTAVYRKKGRR